MKKFNRLLLTVIICMIVLTAVANIVLIYGKEGDEGRPYRVEAERIALEIERGNQIELSNYKYIDSVEKYEGTDPKFFEQDKDYLIKIINGSCYRFNYFYSKSSELEKTLLILNICLAIVYITVIIFLLYIRRKILAPFEKISKMPSELAKGNLTKPLEADKNSFFGGFLWGLDLLREKIEKGKQQDLELQKNKKSLILSLSHDIKTPLGIIELNSKALERGLYENDEEKKKKIVISINEKCVEIKNYVDEIIRASKEDFLELKTDNREFYISEVIDSIKNVYIEKMSILQIGFKIGEFTDCLVKGDPERTVEVLQNLLENAIKYGDGESISISFTREENSLLISTINTGCTLNDAELPHIFDSFWRGSNTDGNSGSGLGLYICRQLMGMMNGDIFAEMDDGRMKVTIVLGMA